MVVENAIALASQNISSTFDYITKPKPYELSELLARIRTLLQRGSTVLTKVLCWGQLQLDPNNCEVMCQGKAVHLTPKEYKLLELFLRLSGKELKSWPHSLAYNFPV